jgi:(2R)-sulfolactate sulfo-lyase subunit alpha
MTHFLTHDAVDTVVDLEPETDLNGRNLADNSSLKARSKQAIPLGHKLALRDFAVGDDVLKYGCVIGRIVAPVKAGEHVHTHNLKTRRWA